MTMVYEDHGDEVSDVPMRRIRFTVNGQKKIAAQIFAQRGNGGELPGPERDGVGGVGLNRGHAHGQHRRKG